MSSPSNDAARAVRAVVIQDVSDSDSVPARAQIERWVRLALGDPRGELTVRIVGEAEGAMLNERYRGGRGPTNVLAFAPGDLVGPHGVPPLGDVVICAPVVEREAIEQGKSLHAHWAHISIHGVLHLVGYDHRTEEQAQVMEARERDLLAGLGIADPYASDG